MLDIEKWGLGEGGYVFLSHSHKDISEVRKIRNDLEKKGFEPLCFYLKCLEKDSEIFNLVEREIAAREWFVYLESSNAKQSEWVQKELEYAQKSGKEIYTVDLEKETLPEIVSDRIASKMRVFFSCSIKDAEIAREMRSYFISKDLKVYYDDLNDFNFNGQDSIQDIIIEASKNGCVVVLITKNSINSSYCEMELECAVQNGAMILPIIIGDVEIPPKFEFNLSKHPCLRFQNENEIDMEKVYGAAKTILSFNGNQ